MDYILSEVFHHDLSAFGLPAQHGSFIELQKAVILWLVLCDCGFCSGGLGIEILASSLFPLMDENKRLV